MESNNKLAYWLPSASGDKVVRYTSVNSVVIIGANGSGKSRLGAWMERQDFEKVHRVAAQRNLNFSERVPLKSYSEAEEAFFYGSSQYKEGKKSRWDWGKGYTTKLLDDFDDVLAALIAQVNLENQRFVDSCRDAEERGEQKPQVPRTSLDRLREVWDVVFPHRSIEQEDASFYAYAEDRAKRYSATQMSDGERSVLYLAAQVLCVPASKIIIMDEPEVHLHPSLMGHLWSALESARPDCLFIYITHDVSFATSHRSSDTIWIKKFDGDNWELEDVPQSDLPKELLVELLGNRKRVLFVEGTKDSLDKRLYSALFKNCYVVPSGGCEQVVANVRAYSRTPALHLCKAWGIIDRDFKEDDVLASYASENVYALDVAEVENLFITEEVVEIMARRFCVDEETALNDVKSEVFGRFDKQLESQISKAIMAGVKSRLAAVNLRGKTLTDAQEISEAIGIEEVAAHERARFQDAADSGDYKSILRVFNEKSLANSVGCKLGINNKAYIEKALMLLESDSGTELRVALLHYVPHAPFDGA